jgi:hypothetical protein
VGLFYQVSDCQSRVANGCMSESLGSAPRASEAFSFIGPHDDYEPQKQDVAQARFLRPIQGKAVHGWPRFVRCGTRSQARQARAKRESPWRQAAGAVWIGDHHHRRRGCGHRGEIYGGPIGRAVSSDYRVCWFPKDHLGKALWQRHTLKGSIVGHPSNKTGPGL